jgi:2-oxoglutarate dehydrogenase E2 component (dihydrolipoamide succinyltransferase)
VRAGTILALIGERGESASSIKEPQAEEARAAGSEEATHPERTVQSGAGESTALVNGQKEEGRAAGSARSLGFISPVVARIAQEHQLDLAQVTGTGLGGRITKNDVLAFIQAREGRQVEALPQGETLTVEKPAERPATPRAVPAPPPPEKPPAPSLPPGEVAPLTAVRRAIAEHMVMSKRTSPHVTTVMEADMSRVTAHRQAHKAAFERDGAHLTFTAYFAAAAVAALKAYPIVNSSWSEEGILLHRQINLGIAASLGEEGLIVPVLKNADSLSLLGLARAVNDLANRARSRRLQPDEVKGGTFTITNHGTTGSLFATPIINQPQAAILGVGKIQKRVLVIEQPAQDGLEAADALAIRPMVYLTLTFDHRLLDGALGDLFLGKVVETLEKWK